MVLVLRQAQDEDQSSAAGVENLILSLSKDEVFASEVGRRPYSRSTGDSVAPFASRGVVMRESLGVSQRSMSSTIS